MPALAVIVNINGVTLPLGNEDFGLGKAVSWEAMKFRMKEMEHSNKASTQEQEDSLTQSVRVFPGTDSSHIPAK